MQTTSSTKNASVAEPTATNQARGSAAWEVRFLWLLVLILLGYWVYGQVRTRIDPEVHRYVLKLLRARYPHHTITLQSAHVVESKGIVLDGLRIGLQRPEGLMDVVRVGRVTAAGNICVVDLLKGKLNIDEVKIDDLTVSVWPVNETIWSVQTLSNSDPLPENLPPVSVRSGIVRILSNIKSKDEIILHDLNVNCRLFKSNTAEKGMPYSIQAQARSNSFDLLSVKLAVSRDKKEWTIEGGVTNARLTQELFRKLPIRSQASLTHLSGFDGIVSSTFVLNQPRNGELTFEVNGDIHNGSLVHPRLPYPLDRLAGKVYCRKDYLRLQDATAVSGAASFNMNAEVYGENAPTPITVKLIVQNLPIDNRLYQVLTPKLKAVWNDLEPSGTANGTIQLQYEGGRWKPRIDADVRDVSVRFVHFPYPVVQARGHVYCDDQTVTTSGLEGMAGGVETSLVLLMNKRTDFWAYDASITTRQAIKIDDELLSSLTPRKSSTTDLEKFIRSLHPTGHLQVKQAKFVRNSKDELPYKLLQLEVRDGAIAFDHFRYPIFGIHGEVSVVNSQVTIDSLRGHNDSASVRCSGVAQCDRDDLRHMQLIFDATNVPLEEELRLALPAGTRQLWDAVQPNGVVDQVAIRLSKELDKDLDIAVTIEENIANKTNANNSASSVTVRPKEIPYPLTDICCRIQYQNSNAFIERFSGVHDVSTLSATGNFLIANDGTWSGLVEWLPDSRLVVDQNLLSCLPNYLQQPILSTAFRGPVSIMGNTHFASSATENSLVVRDCELDLAIEEGRLGWGDIANGIRGSVRLRGIYDDHNMHANGHLNLDCLSIYGVPILNLMGPFAIQDGNIYMGRDSRAVVESQAKTYVASPFQLASIQRPVVETPTEYRPAATNNALNNSRTDPNFLHPADDPKMPTDPSDMTAACFGGRLYLHGVHEIATARSRLNLQLQEADMRETLMDLSNSADQISGKYWAECVLQGCLHNQQTLAGYGKAWLRRADIVQMPVMTKMFRALRINDSRGGVFESGEVHFRVEGDKLPLDKISLDGDIISLRGAGLMNLRRDIDLDLFAYVGKRSPIAAVLGPIVSHNDNASLMGVEVDGKLDSMNVRRSFNLINPNAAELFPERIFSAN